MLVIIFRSLPRSLIPSLGVVLLVFPFSFLDRVTLYSSPDKQTRASLCKLHKEVPSSFLSKPCFVSQSSKADGIAGGIAEAASAVKTAPLKKVCLFSVKCL